MRKMVKAEETAGEGKFSPDRVKWFVIPAGDT